MRLASWLLLVPMTWALVLPPRHVWALERSLAKTRVMGSDSDRDPASGLQRVSRARAPSRKIAPSTTAASESRIWLSPDPAIMVSPELAVGLPEDLNLFGYAANNPVRLVDLTGEQPIEFMDAVNILFGDAGASLDDSKLEEAANNPGPAYSTIVAAGIGIAAGAAAIGLGVARGIAPPVPPGTLPSGDQPPAPPSDDGTKDIPLDDLTSPKDTVDHDDRYERAADGVKKGEADPIDVEKSKDGKYRIQDGVRRSVGAREQGKKSIKAKESPATPGAPKQTPLKNVKLKKKDT